MTQAEPAPSPAPGPAPVAAPIVLPRPNLGPEPWSEPAAGRLTPAAVGLVLVLLVAALAAVGWHRRRADRRTGATAAPEPDLALTPTGRLIASSVAVRAALVAEFGPTWTARTTPEIAADPALAARLGPSQAAAVVAYLDQVDRVKFAGDESMDLDQWIESAAAILGHCRALAPRRPA